MHIKELEIEDFKSCAGKITIPFLKGFTSIAGPNGSGKSNIIDSILFCLGLSATKASIRVDSLKDFINWKSKHDRTSVKIIFADDKNNDIMKVRREVKKTSAGYISAYQLNDKNSSLTEIHEQLLKYNVTPNSYNVLMQYEITKITAATPLNRRRILDEIAGVADFDRRIEQAMKELAVVEDRLEKSVIVLDTINERLTVLKEQKELALKYQQLREEKSKYESMKSTVKYFDLKNSLERVHENILENNKTKKQQEKELAKREQEFEATKIKLQEISALVQEKGEKEQLELKAQINAHKGNITLKQNTLEHEEKQKTQNILAIENCNNNINGYKDKIDDLKLKIDNKNDEIKSYEDNLQTEKENLDKVTEDMNNLNSQNTDNVKKRAALRSELENKRDESNKITGEILPVKNDIDVLERNLTNAQEFVNSFDDNNKSKLDEKDKLDVKIEELNKELNDYQLTQKSLISNSDDIKGKIDDNNRNINLAFRKITELETKQQTIATYSRNPAEFIMQAKIRGVHAPLAQLGEVDTEFETALEVAMGGRMASVVVEDDDVAQVCIDTLNASKAGRVTFLPLNKIKPAPDLNPPNINGVIDYAINLIEFDDKYYDAFYLALSDTLIVEDRLTAKKLLGKYRMVDLNGSLYDKSAAITGGSLSQNRMKFSTSENKELETYKQKLRKLQDLADTLDENKKETDRKIDLIRDDYSQANSDLAKCTNQRDNLISELDNAQKNFEANKQFIEENAPKLNEAKAKLNELETQQNELLKSIEQLEKDIVTVENEIPEEELRKLDEESDAIQAEIARYRTLITNATNEITGINSDIEFTKQLIGMQQEQIKKLEQANEEFDKNKKLSLEQIEQINVKVEELEEKVKEIGETLTELQAERDKVQNEVLEHQNQKINLENNLARLAESLEALKGRRKELEPELETIRNELIEAGYSVASLQPVEISTEELEKAISKLEKKMHDLGDVNMVAIKEYDECSARKDELQTKLDTLSNEKQEIQNRMQGYEDKKKSTFLDAFNAINTNFQTICPQLFEGTGSLVLENPSDPLNGGLNITAQFRSKDEAKKLTSLSGGEKTLTALAFVFAIQRYLPAPFYALDEADASLDGVYAAKLMNMIKEQSKNTQFIVVSHHKNMIESASRTIGITLSKGMTKATGITN